MDNLAFQLPATQVKTEMPVIRKKESASDKTASSFNRLLDRTMSSQQNVSVSEEDQTDAKLDPNEHNRLMGQGMTNGLISTLVAVPPTVIVGNSKQTLTTSEVSPEKMQITGALPNTANHPASTLLTSHLQHQDSTPSLSTMVSIADGQTHQLTVQGEPAPKQLETSAAILPQAELQAKLSDVVSTKVNPFNQGSLMRPDVVQPSPADLALQASPISSDDSQLSPVVIPQPPKLQAELPKFLSDTMSMPIQTPQTNELPLANQPVTLPGRREQIVVKQTTGTELSTVTPAQAQSVLNQQNQDDSDSLLQNSFSSNHGIAEMRASKIDEPFTDTSQQTTTPNHQEIIRQIVDRARLYLRPANQSEMVLQLRPEHLGELTVKVSVESGLANATFHSDNPEVRQVIEASLPQLKQDLSQQGIKLDNVSVFSGSEQFFDNRQRSAQQQQSVPIRKNRRELLQAIESADELSVSIPEGVDYRI